jgi:hypothetical protein
LTNWDFIFLAEKEIKTRGILIGIKSIGSGRLKNKMRIAADFGGKVFETIYNIGTGDVFYVGAGLSDSIRYNLNRIFHLQGDMDKDVNTVNEVRGRKRYWVTYTDSLETVLF